MSYALIGCKTSNAIVSMNAYDYFKTVLCGVFDNKNQVEAEKKAGKQVHPYAKHVTDIATIKNVPASMTGYFILEESYYTYEGKSAEIKPYLFYIEHLAVDKIRLSSYLFPADLPKEAITNANKNLNLDFSQLTLSSKFSPAVYVLKDKKFTVNHPNDLGNGMRFTLIETLSKDRLEVMELLEKDGQRLTPYDTPIIYERIKK
jgi:hypothetical protein